MRFNWGGGWIFGSKEPVSLLLWVAYWPRRMRVREHVPRVGKAMDKALASLNFATCCCFNSTKELVVMRVAYFSKVCKDTARDFRNVYLTGASVNPTSKF